MIGLFATKLGMSQLFTKEGYHIPITILKVNKNIVIQKKSIENDGYTALKVGYDLIRNKLVNKAKNGIFKKNKILPCRFLREIKVDDTILSNYKIGDIIDTDIFKNTDKINVTAISKGKGFSGVMKRHNFKGFRQTHGTHESFRGGGSIGQCTKPGKVFKGKKMAGQYGNKTQTVLYLKIIEIRKNENLIFVKGAVPGYKGSLVKIKSSIEKKV